MILLNTKVWATTEVTFEVFPFEPVFPTFLFTLAGFIDAGSHEAYNVILHAWNDDWIYDEFVGHIVKDPHFLAGDDPDTQTQWLAASFHQMLDSLEVNTLDIKLPGNIPAPCFNIFAKIPTNEPRQLHGYTPGYERPYLYPYPVRVDTHSCGCGFARRLRFSYPQAYP